ncbi:smf Mn2+ and Fe2+ transporter-like protein [Obba rivulosa]|uniref:Smf Mn2+ and Fe2+ transporter-like protein n=1 Tax=Obba rivulosa TaxID=1052685 RepID=A0A8E2J689_9APHY|nr:smf Mn2+ and Fe2+ transporter-like protein [Obba rivulosa]
MASRLRSGARLVFNHATKHTGVGIICAVAYFDPGNWGVDLQAGSEFGYKLLFVVLLAGLIAVYMQVLASRLGCVTGLDLAAHCRLLLHDRPKHTWAWRWLALYPLYALAEVAIISTDLAELLGSAMALCMLFPQLPLWAGVLLTASDVLILLALRDPLRGKPVRLFELMIAALVFTVLVCMAIIVSQAGVHWGQAFDGFVPSSALFKSGALYTSIGILGATVMPHSLFLGSALATQDRVSSKGDILYDASIALAKPIPSLDSNILPSAFAKKCASTVLRKFKRSVCSVFQILPVESEEGRPKSHAERSNNCLSFIRAHLWHGIVDMVISLLGLAVVINSLILILAGAEFHRSSDNPATLFDAYDLLQDRIGVSGATLFALALLASGQSSSIVATMAGQTVSEGFLQWRISPVLRRLLTRLLGLVPSMAVAVALGRAGIATLLVTSQVILSIVLPFMIFPLIYLTSSRNIMSVKKSQPEPIPITPAVVLQSTSPEGHMEIGESLQLPDEFVDFSNGRFTMCLGYVIWLAIVVANVYAIVTLATGQE